MTPDQGAGMTDRELLELAAKAAGIDAQWDCPERGMMILTPDGTDTLTWNPLTDDGDALRLAVELEMSVRIHNGFSWVKNVEGSTPHGDDPYAATRRAIVRAAAQIGENNGNE